MKRYILVLLVMFPSLTFAQSYQDLQIANFYEQTHASRQKAQCNEDIEKLQAQVKALESENQMLELKNELLERNRK